MTTSSEDKEKEEIIPPPIIDNTMLPEKEKKKRGRKKKVTVLEILNTNQETNVEEIKNENEKSEEEVKEGLEYKDIQIMDEEIEKEKFFLSENNNVEEINSQKENEEEILEDLKEPEEGTERKKRKYKKRKNKEKEPEIKKSRKYNKVKKITGQKVYGVIWRVTSANPYFEPKPRKNMFQILFWQNIMRDGREERDFIAKYSRTVTKSQLEVEFPGCRIENTNHGMIENFRMFCSEERIGDINGYGKEIPKFLDKLRLAKGFLWDGENFSTVKLTDGFKRRRKISSFNPNFQFIKFYFISGKQDMSLCEYVYKIFHESDVYSKSNKSKWIGYFAQKCVTFEYFSTTEFVAMINEIASSANFSHISNIFVFGYDDMLLRLEREIDILGDKFDLEGLKRKTEEVYELSWTSDELAIEICCKKKVKPEFSLETSLYLFLEEVIVNKAISNSLNTIFDPRSKTRRKTIITPLNVKDYCTGMLFKLKEKGYEIEKAQDIVKGICASKFLDYEIHSEEEEVKRIEEMLYE